MLLDITQNVTRQVQSVVQISQDYRNLGAIAIALLSVFSQAELTFAANHSVNSAAKPKPPIIRPIRLRTACPSELKPLAKAMLRDLPNYINRLNHQRPSEFRQIYAIAASQPDFEPLPTLSLNHLSDKNSGIHQIFFTVLERQYSAQQKTEFQNYHWLFLTKTGENNWELAMLYSRLGSYPQGQQFPSPMQETSRGITGRAIRLWLRDCKAGAIPLP